MQAQRMACGPRDYQFWKEEQFPSFSPYLGVFKVVMVADSVCQKDLCTGLQFIGQGTDKWIPPSPAAPNVSHRKKIGRSQA